MQTQLDISQKTVNTKIRICVNCGSVDVNIESYGISCKDCGSFFDVEKENDE